MQTGKKSSLSRQQKAGIAVLIASLLLPVFWFAASQLLSLRTVIDEVTLPGVQNIHMQPGETLFRSVQTDATGIQTEDLEIIVEDTQIIRVCFVHPNDSDGALQLKITALSPGSTSMYVQIKGGSIRSAACSITVEEATSAQQTQRQITEQTKPTATTSVATTQAQQATAREYVLNTNSKKFHYPDCSGILHMKESNRQEVNDTRDHLIAQGYSPCGLCNP